MKNTDNTTSENNIENKIIENDTSNTTIENDMNNTTNKNNEQQSKSQKAGISTRKDLFFLNPAQLRILQNMKISNSKIVAIAAALNISARSAYRWCRKLYINEDAPLKKRGRKSVPKDM
ncbi:hypothetical protein CDIK_3399 [Cucumispora dikerogammari]|nr:hypothetical protein CDIK_3399 [Cucumispora dikerogammari]